jgi:hypothetical protein
MLAWVSTDPGAVQDIFIQSQCYRPASLTLTTRSAATFFNS